MLKLGVLVFDCVDTITTTITTLLIITMITIIKTIRGQLIDNVRLHFILPTLCPLHYALVSLNDRKTNLCVVQYAKLLLSEYILH